MAKSSSRLSIYGLRSAVIGCKYGQWKLRSEPNIDDTILLNTYFDEDAAMDMDVPVNPEKAAKNEVPATTVSTVELPIGKEKWTGNGNFTLPRFELFVDFLHSMIVKSDQDKDK